MTDKLQNAKPETPAAGEREVYVAPTLVHHGSLFVTGMPENPGGKTCSNITTVADNGATDICDADGGPIDGPK